MSRYNFKGYVENVTERHLEFVSSVLEKRGIKGQDVFLEQVGAIGDNYIADVRRTVVDNDGTPFKMFLKLAPTDPVVRKGLYTEIMFTNEHIMYTEVLPKFRQIQLDANLTGNDLYRFPECYGSSIEEFNEILILEDLKESNFTTQDRFKAMNEECIKSVLKSLAIFHSISYVVKHREPETFAAWKAKLQDIFSHSTFKDEKSRLLHTYLQETALDVVHDERSKNAVKNTVGDLYFISKRFREAEDEDSKYLVIRQGDSWSNNVMFRIENGVLRESLLIDYQLGCSASPAYDIMYFLFNSTNHEQRQKHYHEFIDYYYSELEKALQHYGLKASVEYPRSQLEADLKKYGKFALGLTLFISIVTSNQDEDAAKMKEGLKLLGSEDTPGVSNEDLKKSFEVTGNTLEAYKKKVLDLVASFLEFGLV